MYKDDLQAKDVYSGSSIFNPANQIKSFLFDLFYLSNFPDLLYFLLHFVSYLSLNFCAHINFVLDEQMEKQ